jgi:hypothetical protein
LEALHEALVAEHAPEGPTEHHLVGEIHCRASRWYNCSRNTRGSRVKFSHYSTDQL